MSFSRMSVLFCMDIFNLSPDFNRFPPAFTTRTIPFCEQQ
nr:MAG TPA: hypothetical protein [Bacteriophage sp.]